MPEWLRVAARTTVPSFPDDPSAVVLLDEVVTTVKENGDIETAHRRAIKVLRPEGTDRSTTKVYFDDETRLTYLKGWSISARGEEYEVKERDAVETALFDLTLYSDARCKVLSVPAVHPGAVVGFEHVQKHRPRILQDTWTFQEDIPIVRARYVLRMPPGWEYESVWLNHPDTKPRTSGSNEWTWELEKLSAIEPEPSMPPLEAFAGRLALTFYSGQGVGSGKSHGSWSDVGKWYGRLIAHRRQASPEIKQKTLELTATATEPLEKIRALAMFVQREIRYVAIEIGIGGHQPHPAKEVLATRYGDCKDKVTLLSAMLKESGFDSYYVLIHHKRGVLAPQFPSALSFDHVILAIRLPEGAPSRGLYAMTTHEKLGTLVFFDPTDSVTPLGYLPQGLQSNYGLLVTEDGGDLIQLPLLAPSLNRLLRSATLTLRPDGGLEGTVQELLWGAHATRLRSALVDAPASDRTKVLENFLGEFLGGLVFQGAQLEGLEECDKALVVRYSFLAKNYAKIAGSLMLLRPRVLGQKTLDLLEGKERKHAVEFASASLESDMFDILLPTGFQVDELPPPVSADCGFADYESETKVEGHTLKYRRNLAIKSVHVPKDRLGELKEFFRQVSADERNSAVLKRPTP